jgi:predicted component of type VI protein secretion system
MAELASGLGRIHIYRNSSRAPLVQPAVKLNGEVVGVAKPTTRFYLDRPPGRYDIQASTEEKTLNFPLAAGEEAFIRLTVTFGLIGGTVVPERVSKETGQAEMKDLPLIQPGAKP